MRTHGVAALGTALLLACAPSLPAADNPPLFLLGGDVSLTPKIEANGIVFKDAARPKDIFAIFRDHGANCIRLRLFVHPNGRDGVVNDLPYTVALAKRVKAAGLLFSLDFHYSDTWADPGHQSVPAEWHVLLLPPLADRVRDYTAQSIRAFRDAGAMPDVVQIGNEITNGLMWPAGRLDHGFEDMATLLKAGVTGVRLASAGLPTRPKIMLHIDRGANRGIAQWFFEHLDKTGVPFDLIGLSYYPFYSGGLDGLRETLAYLARTYHKPVAVVETAYLSADPPWLKAEERKNLTFPLTPEGQRDFLRTLIQTVRETPDGLGAGVLWWYPESVPVKDPAVDGWYGGDAAMFDRAGNALPLFGAFSAPGR